GTFRHVKKNGVIIYADIQTNIIEYNGKAARLVFANDISERLNHIEAIESQNQKLKEIAWIQSHIVRAPLSRIMGLVTLAKDHQTTENEKNEILDYLLTSAYELDGIIKDIYGKAGQVVLKN
ncbi:MAG: domain S-box protein, partial [Daejeonella sp.]|nr:domain S-box protein [Daejeonella sp.]